MESLDDFGDEARDLKLVKDTLLGAICINNFIKFEILLSFTFINICLVNAKTKDTPHYFLIFSENTETSLGHKKTSIFTKIICCRLFHQNAETLNAHSFSYR